MKQKIVIKVAMSCDKCRSKAMALAAGTCGVESVEIAGDSDKVVVVGDVDSIKLTKQLRKKVGPAQLVEVSDATKKKEPPKEEKKPPKEEKKAPECPWPCYCPPYPQPLAVVCDLPSDNACMIL